MVKTIIGFGQNLNSNRKGMLNLQKTLSTEIQKQNLLYHVAQSKLYQFPLFQPVTSLEIW